MGNTPALDAHSGIAGFLDVETTGLNPNADEIIELCIALFRFNRKTGALLEILDTYTGLRQPARPVPAAVSRINGLTDAMLKGKSLDPESIEALFAQAEFVIAHNMSFDREFVVRLFPQYGAKTWLCSMKGIAWKRKGFTSAGLQYLAQAHGIEVGEAHRAWADVQTGLHLLAQRNKKGKPYLSELLKKLPATGSQVQDYPPDAAEESALKVPDPESCFIDGGLMAKAMPSFELRPQQLIMSQAVYSALAQSQKLLVEAGTGTGKSLAYLIPAIAWSLSHSTRVMVATYTKALQEQLILKDMPIAQAVFAQAGLTFTSALLMGSQNYLCLSRLYRCLNKGLSYTAQHPVEAVLERLRAWSVQTPTGLMSAIPFKVPHELWDEVCRNPDYCLNKLCPHKESCLYKQDLLRACRANVVVVNQHLFFAGNPLSYDAVIFDEAHNLEDVAQNFLGFNLTDRKVKRLLDDLYNARTGHGMLKRFAGHEPHWLQQVLDRIVDTHAAAQDFFYAVRECFTLPATSPEACSLRVKSPGIVPDNISLPLLRLKQSLEAGMETAHSLEEENELKVVINRCAKMLTEVNFFLECARPDHAYWLEVNRAKRGSAVSLNVSPLEVSSYLKTVLWERSQPAVLTSATLAAGSSFSLLKHSLGLEQCREVILDSPFNYKQQVLIHLATKVPDPKLQFQAYEAEVIKRCLNIIALAAQGIFILFTSWQLLLKMQAVLNSMSLNRPVFVQGELAPQKLLEAFKLAGNGILLGTDTFWQGVDVPGAALSCVVITRLPFTAPDSPLEEAKHELMRQKGMDVFNQYTMPKAIIKFRQGFGRLIRSHQDTGAIIVLDPRVRTKSYGAKFLAAIPECRMASRLEDILTL